MKFIISSSVLLKQLNSINGIVCENPIVPVLEKFLFQLENQNLECTVNSAQDITCKINTTENTLEAQFILKTDADDIDEIILEIYKDNKKLLDIHDYDFEKVVRRLFFSLGYDVFPTKRTRDGGYDMLLRREDPIIPLTHLVECKSTKKKNNFAYAVHLGAATEFAPGVNGELTYSYRDMGKFKKAKDSNVSFSALKGHHVAAGVRFDL